MSDKFFDKDNNFILWKDKGDLTEASKYVGDNRSLVNTGESLVTKIAKGKIDIGREFDSSGGVIEKALTVNWGKCGGSSDVIVTYGENEPLWVPYAFIRNAFDSSLVPKTNIFDKQVGYQGLLGDKHISGYDEAIYKLPSNIGSYLYANAETGSGYGGDGNSSNLYKGIAFYPDTVSNWEKSSTMGIGIRKKSDIGTYSTIQSAITVPTTVTSNLEDDAYYLVAQLNKTTADNIIVLNGHLNSCFPLTSDNGTDHLYLRHWVDMDDVPSATNMGEKYTCPSELCSDVTTYTETKDSIEVNWGKCGGEEDVIVEYKVGEGIWIPSDFLKQAFDYTSHWQSIGEGSANYYVGEEIGYRGGRMTGSSSGLAVYNIPQELGRYLYENAESLPNKGYYGQTAENWTRAYKGLAIYPDHIGTDSSSDWENNTHCWGIGIRTKSDIDVQGYYADGSFSTTFSDMKSGDFYNKMEEGIYYLVAQIKVFTSSSTMNRSISKEYLQGQLSLFNIDDTGTDHIYLRHFADMTSVPSATNKGKKYTVTLDMVTSHPTLPTPNEDQVVIDWGGGIKTYYKYGEPMYVPRAFLMEAFDGVGSDNKVIHKPDNIGNHVGYQCWIPNSLAIYRLPNEIGEYLYNSAESWAVGENLAYNCTNSIDSGHMADGRLYKGIAIYPDTFRGVSASFNFGVGIRKKSDLLVWKLNSVGSLVNTNSVYDTTLLDDNAYYLVAQTVNVDSTSSYEQLYGQLASCFPKDEPIWFRHWKGMTAYPSPTNMGKKMAFHEKLPMGGKIFYIDPSDNGASYKFFDANENEIKGWSTIADLANAMYYLIIGNPSKDKVYVYYPTKYGSLQWGYYNTSVGITGTAVGTGKTNTELIMSRSVIPTGTIWSKLSEIRTSSGIDDLFIPSKDEIDKFREANLESWARKSGGSNLWASSESGSQSAYLWQYYGQAGGYIVKYNIDSVFFIRSF